jgi:hypothetical protein
MKGLFFAGLRTRLVLMVLLVIVPTPGVWNSVDGLPHGICPEIVVG